MRSRKQKKVVIVGGGITGLSAAWYLRSALQTDHADIELAEQSDRFGGKIETIAKDGFVIEKGPDSFLARKPAMVELAQELGLESELTGTDPRTGKTYILHRGRFHRMPEGLVMGIPTRMGPFLRTGLLSVGGKLRAALDLVLPAAGGADEALGDFLRRRLGREVQENIAEPLLSGIYAGDPGKLSLRATFPQFRMLEQKHRSLILGMTRSRKPKAGPTHVPTHLQNSTFLTFKGGLQTIIRRLEQQLPQKGVQLARGKRLLHLKTSSHRYELTWHDGSVTVADAVVLALPAYALAPLFSHMEAVQAFANMPYVSVANVAIAFDKPRSELYADASGYLIPRKEGRDMTACTVTSVKWAHSAPADKLLLRCYIGGSHDQTWIDKDDEALYEQALREVRDLLQIDARPLFYEVTRWMRAMPQYTSGHLERVEAMRAELADRMPGIIATGSGYGGVGLPDCVRQGKEAAAQVVQHLHL